MARPCTILTAGCLVVCVALGGVWPHGSTATGQDQQQPPARITPPDGTSPKESSTDEEIRLFMRAKLTSSQKLLEGLVIEDFGKIEKGAQEMLLLSKGNNWPRTEDKIYNHFNQAFQMQCEKIAELAKQENLEGVKFSYLQLTTSCVDCHNYVRKRFAVQRPANRRGPVQLIPTYWDDK